MWRTILGHSVGPLIILLNTIMKDRNFESLYHFGFQSFELSFAWFNH